jgi:hypothetical protein
MERKLVATVGKPSLGEPSDGSSGHNLVRKDVVIKSFFLQLPIFRALQSWR